MNIFFDLDGTLWDSRDRLYTLFCDLTNTKLLSKDEYWSIKRSKVSNEEILRTRLGLSEEKVTEFSIQWMKKIEAPEYLALDRVFPFTVSTLEECKNRGFIIYYVTLRQSSSSVLQEITDNGIDSYCKRCLVSDAKTTKEALVREVGISLTPSDVFVGDTGIDVMTGKALGIRNVAVLSGFRNREILEGYSPEVIINDVSELKTLL